MLTLASERLKNWQKRVTTTSHFFEIKKQSNGSEISVHEGSK